MKKILNYLGETLAIWLSVALGLITIWFTYKIFAGIYHLLDKLIDKL